MPVKLNQVYSVAILAGCLTGIGCGDDKTTIPTKLDQPLPPPPVGAGGGGASKAGKAGATGGAAKTEQPTGKAD